MVYRTRHVLNTLGIALLAACLVSCGSGGGRSSSTGQAADVASTTSSPPVTTGKPTGTTQTSVSSTRSAVPSDSSRGAASFRVTKGDNSIPDFGEEAHPSETQRADRALAGFLQARAKGEWSRVCAYLTAPRRRQFETLAKTSKGRPRGCGPVLAALLNGPATTRADPLTNDGIAALRIKNKTAFALFHGPNTSEYVMPMQNENGAWKMTQLTPVPYPLGTPAATTP